MFIYYTCRSLTRVGPLHVLVPYHYACIDRINQIIPINQSNQSNHYNRNTIVALTRYGCRGSNDCMQRLVAKPTTAVAGESALANAVLWKSVDHDIGNDCAIYIYIYIYVYICGRAPYIYIYIYMNIKLQNIQQLQNIQKNIKYELCNLYI